MLRFDLEANVPRKTMNILHSAIYQWTLNGAARYVRNNGLKIHVGSSHIAILKGDQRVAIITEEN